MYARDTQAGQPPFDAQRPFAPAASSTDMITDMDGTRADFSRGTCPGPAGWPSRNMQESCPRTMADAHMTRSCASAAPATCCVWRTTVR